MLVINCMCSSKLCNLLMKSGLSGIILVWLIGCGGGTNQPILANPTPNSPGQPANPSPVSPPASPPEGSCSGNVILPTTLMSDANSDPNQILAIDQDVFSHWEATSRDARLVLDLGAPHQIKSIKLAWYDGDTVQTSFSIMGSVNAEDYYPIVTNALSDGQTILPDEVALSPFNTRFIALDTNFANGHNAKLSEILIAGCALDGSPLQTVFATQPVEFNLDPNAPPSDNFDLLGWGLDAPVDNDNNGRSDRISERTLDAGYSSEFFYTADTGAMVLKSPLYGPKTSTNTSYVRTELRQMMRRGDTSISTQGANRNNWQLGYQPQSNAITGGRGGRLDATLAVNQVSISGVNYQLGRVIIGQIHASSDEPLRLYYRKRPEHNTGYIYLAHEINGADDLIFMVYGPEYDNTDNQPNFTNEPSVGIALDDIFSYQIIQIDARIDVLIRNGTIDGPIIGHQSVDMRALNSGYDLEDEWMYFKAGVYSGNNTGGNDEFNQASFYHLRYEH